MTAPKLTPEQRAEAYAQELWDLPRGAPDHPPFRRSRRDWLAGYRAHEADCERRVAAAVAAAVAAHRERLREARCFFCNHPNPLINTIGIGEPPAGTPL